MNVKLVILLVGALAATTLPATAQDAGEGARTLVVGVDAPTVQATVDAASPGDTVLVPAGTYQEAVIVTSPGITITGEARDLTVMEGGGELSNAFTVVADGVTIKTLTVQNYSSNGMQFTRVTGFRMTDLHARDNAAYGLYAIHSEKGEVSYSYAEGHGDGGIYLGETIHCDCDVHHNVAWNNMLGYSGTANSYVRIWANEFHNNRAGILMSVLPQEMGFDDEVMKFYGTQVGTQIYDNYVHHNNNKDVPEVGIWQTVHVPVGEGITIAGGWNNKVYDNNIVGNELWGVGVFWLTTQPRGNEVYDNHIDGGRYALWWDEQGENNCFENNAAVHVDTYSDPDPLPSCASIVPVPEELCPDALEDWYASDCRVSDARAPSAYKDAWLAYRSLNDQDPEADPVTLP